MFDAQLVEVGQRVQFNDKDTLSNSRIVKVTLTRFIISSGHIFSKKTGKEIGKNFNHISSMCHFKL